MSDHDAEIAEPYYLTERVVFLVLDCERRACSVHISKQSAEQWCSEEQRIQGYRVVDATVRSGANGADS